MNVHVWWYLARASGIVAWGLGLASVLWGLALATRGIGDKPRPPWLLAVHRHLGGLTLLFVLVHLGALVADSYVQFGPGDLFVPFASSWRPAAVAWGVIAFWLLVAVELTSLAMKRIPKRWWRRIHLGSYAVAVLSTLHLFTAGTDASTPALRWITIVTGGATAFFVLYREVGPGKGARAAARLAVDRSN